MTSWRLQELRPDLLQFYEAIAKANGMSLDVLLGGLSDSFQARMYSFDEVQEDLESLRALVRAKPNAESRKELAPNASEPRSNGRKADVDTLVLYLDPTCEICTQKLMFSHRLEQDCPTEAPALVLRALPADNALSVEAAVMLKRIATESPDQYISAFFETSSMVSENAALLPEISANYLRTRSLRSMPWYKSVLKKVEEERRRTREVFPSRDYQTPLLLFRGRVLQTLHGAHFAFEPLHDAEVLLRTLQIIAGFDAVPNS